MNCLAPSESGWGRNYIPSLMQWWSSLAYGSVCVCKSVVRSVSWPDHKIDGVNEREQGGIGEVGKGRRDKRGQVGRREGKQKGGWKGQK